jgi:hypothetical protein
MTEVKKKLGGVRPGAGRKSAAVEKSVRDAIRRATKKDPKAIERVWQKVIQKAEEGSERHAALLFSYQYGKPVEQVQVTTKQLIFKRIIVTIDASTGHSDSRGNLLGNTD